MEDSWSEGLDAESRFELALFKAKNFASALEDAANLDILSVPTATTSSGFSSETTVVSCKHICVTSNPLLQAATKTLFRAEKQNC